MNLFQAANGAATFLILSALVASLAKNLDSFQGSLLEYPITHITIVYLGLFIVIFRIKTFLDDHRHFAEPYQDKTNLRYVGFVLAILSWLLWGIAAYLLPSTLRASELMATSIMISTLWVVVHVFEIFFDSERRRKEGVISLIRHRWVFINVGYMLCLVAYVGWFRPVVDPGASAPLLVLLGLLLYDVFTSRSFRGVVNLVPSG